MPEPLHPPFTAGSLTIPRQLDRWLDINPQGGALTRTQAYITLPAFSVNVNWQGYSDIVAAFNFEGPNNFSLKSFSALPVLPNYVLCVSWTDNSNNVVRYKVWSGVGEVMPFDAPLYTGQLIKKNFRFEVWSTNSTPAVQSTALTFYTSVLGNVDYRFGSDFTLVNNDGLVNNFANVSAAIAIPDQNILQYHLKSTDNLVKDISDNFVSWKDTISAKTFLPTGGVGVLTVDLQQPEIAISGIAGHISSAGVGASAGVVAIAFSLNSLGHTGTIFDNGGGVVLSYDSGAQKFNAFADAVSNITPTIGVWYLALITPSSGVVTIYVMSTGIVFDFFFGNTALGPDTTLQVGGAFMNCVEVIVYNGDLGSAIDYLTLISYFGQTYYSTLTLPLTFPANSLSQPN